MNWVEKEIVSSLVCAIKLKGETFKQTFNNYGGIELKLNYSEGVSFKNSEYEESDVTNRSDRKRVAFHVEIQWKSCKKCTRNG